MKPQRLLDYEQGGVRSTVYARRLNLTSLPPGLEPCIAIRWREYKWMPVVNKLWRCVLQSYHVGTHVHMAPHL